MDDRSVANQDDFSYIGEEILPDWVMDNHRDNSGAVWYGASADPRRPDSGKPQDPKFVSLVDGLFEPNPLRSHVITLHLYVEHWLDKLMEGVGDSVAGQTFFKKTQILEAKGAIEGDLLHNIRLINKIRNIFAHELDLEAAEIKVREMFLKLRQDPYFSSSDMDPLRAACVQTIFALEATFANECKSLERNEFPHESVRARLLDRGSLFWQECELLNKEVRGTELIYTLRCPLCFDGRIEREKETLVGHKSSYIFPCTNCHLTGDGSSLDLSTVDSEYVSAVIEEE